MSSATLVEEMAPIGAVIASFYQEYTDWVSNVDTQEKLTTEILMPWLCSSFSPSKKYLRSLFRAIKSEIEATITITQESCYHDQLMELLVQYITHNSTVDDEDPAFITYRTDRANQVSLSVYRSHNQVGTRIWSAGIFLSELFIKISSYFHQKVLCELGSGVGVSPLVYLAGCDPSHYPKRVYLTDYSTDVLELLRQNISINSRNYNEQVEVIAEYLNWYHLDELSIFSPVPPDVVFAADCTYSGELHLHLINVFECLICTGSTVCEYLEYLLTDGTFNMGLFLKSYNRSTCKFGLIACTVRNIDTYQDFIMELNKHLKIKYFNVSKWCHEATKEQRYYYEYKGDIEVLLLLPASECLAIGH